MELHRTDAGAVKLWIKAMQDHGMAVAPRSRRPE